MARGLGLTERFLVLFNSLKNAAGGNPERVRTFYRDSEEIRSKFRALQDFLSRTDLERRAFHGRKLLPASAEFERAWKEFDQQWRFRVIWPERPSGQPVEVDLDALLDTPTAGFPAADAANEWRGEQIERQAPDRPTELIAPDPDHEDSFDPLRHDGGAALELGMQHLENEAANAPHDYVGNSDRLAVGAYDYLINTIGLDVSGVFKRWRKLPVFFMPAHVTNSYGASDKGSLTHLVNDAMRAYVFGAPSAAMAMCRAALEMLLKQHYGRGQWDKRDLEKVIVLASERYEFIQRNRIDRLRIAANRILHQYTGIEPLSPEDDKTILEFLKTLKFLIERAPHR